MWETDSRGIKNVLFQWLMGKKDKRNQRKLFCFVFLFFLTRVNEWMGCLLLHEGRRRSIKEKCICPHDV